jgi:hypothetical protein
MLNYPPSSHSDSRSHYTFQ